MPKKYKSLEYLLTPDPKYNNKLIEKFVNSLMLKGKKSVARQICYDAFDTLAKKMPDLDALEVFNTALNNVKPTIEVRSRRIGGATYQVPVQVSSKRQTSLAIRWILQAVRKKKGKPMYLKLADELSAAYKNEGDAVTTKINVHRMAEANKAFAHFAWR